jgi:hypothetical protein
VGARCTPCAIGAVLAQRVLIKEAAADVLAGDDKRAKNLQKQTSTTKDIPASKELPAGKDTRAKETKNENVSDEEGEISEG